MTELVSVLVPCYNHSKYILECLDSIAAQTYASIELIIVDDGSRDESPKIIEEWVAKARGRFVRLSFDATVNRGITRTLASMLERANGKYIALCASDDCLIPDSVARRVTAFGAEESVGMVFGRATLIDTDSNVVNDDAARFLYNASSANLCSPVIGDELFYRWSLVGPVSMYRADVLVKVGGIDTNYAVEDRNLFLRLVLSTQIRFIDATVAHYRYHPTNVSRNPASRRRVSLDIANCHVNMAERFSGFKRLYLASSVVDRFLLGRSEAPGTLRMTALLFVKALRKASAVLVLGMLSAQRWSRAIRGN
jgi:glycosyltransferase involved in cell wall biosynthesis